MTAKMIPALALALAASGPAALAEGPSGLAALPKVATVDERFQSYNVEMVEVTGGRFWAPYGGPVGEVYRQRPPEDLADPRLRALVRQLGPAYVRVSGTWANSTYLEAEGETLAAPPKGYDQILKRSQWRGLVDFAQTVDARIGVSYAVSEGPRGPDGVWRTDQAQRLLDLTREAGGEIAWSEFINEPNAASLGNLPKDYSIADYTRDFGIFRAWAKRAAPAMKIVGPGGVGEGAGFANIPVANLEKMLRTERIMQANPGTVDAVSYHFYGNTSQRCLAMRKKAARKEEALTPGWLDLTLRDLTYYSNLRDRYEPGDRMWITETAQAACGGDVWAATFLDTFRYVNQLGLLAQKGVEVIFHNTLTASDYSLIEEDTRAPRPNYWAAVLWKRTMGTVVLASPPSPSPVLRLYAHCLPGRRGIGIAAVNLSDRPQPVALARGARGWVMQADPIDSKTVTINGRAPQVDARGALSGLDGTRVGAQAMLPAKAIGFYAIEGLRNPACR